MSIYCGTDIIEVERIKTAIIDTLGFKTRIFTNNEIDIIEKSSDNLIYQRYAGRFAAKESIYKAFSKILITNNISLAFNEIEILNDNSLHGRPTINILNNDLNKLILSKNITVDISISHIKEYAIAMVSVAQEN